MNVRGLTSLLLLLTVAAFLLSLMAGKVWIWPNSWAADNADGWIFLELRLPRAVLGLCIGAVLGLSGAVLQGYLRNPLADPTVLGVSASAAFGGVVAIYLGLNLLPFGLFACAMLGAGSSILLLLAISRGDGPVGFILGGMVLSTLAGALTAFVISIAPNPFAANEIINWLMGALTDRLMADVGTALPFMALGVALLLSTGRALDALTLGENGAKSLGINLLRLQWIIVLGVGLAVGASVAVSGVVGFVGLIVPHLIRAIYGEQPSQILLPSALGGAILTLTADSLLRLVPGPGEVRLGIAMAMLGAPFFLLLLLRYRKGAA
jgi:iron complex transport system permease protein